MNIFIILTISLGVLSIALCVVVYHLMNKIDRIVVTYGGIITDQTSRILKLIIIQSEYEGSIKKIIGLIRHYNRDSKGRFAKAKTK